MNRELLERAAAQLHADAQAMAEKAGCSNPTMLEMALDRADMAMAIGDVLEGEPLAWHCSNSVTGRLIFTDVENQMKELRDCKTGHWIVTPLIAAPCAGRAK